MPAACIAAACMQCAERQAEGCPGSLTNGMCCMQVWEPLGYWLARALDAQGLENSSIPSKKHHQKRQGSRRGRGMTPLGFILSLAEVYYSPTASSSWALYMHSASVPGLA